jgi:glycosyltransferase involved in cell wall biosynthesis
MREKIIFLATGWGSKYGGINAFNEDLSSALASLLSERYEVLSAVLSGGEADLLSARQKGVELINLEMASTEVFDSHAVRQMLSMLTSGRGLNVTWWIGHDVFTGPAAVEASQTSKEGRTAIIHHMDYEAYESYKGVDGTTTREKIEKQRRALSAADLVFGVGPKLTDSAREKTAGGDRPAVTELIPGLAEIEGVGTLKRFSAITFGRLGRTTDRIKQTRLAVAAFADAKGPHHDHLGNDSSITIIGLSHDTSDDERSELVNLAEEIAGKAIQIHGWPFLEDREKLFDHLRRQSVCLMLSLHEGFGLAGWESVAAEVPLIVSKNSGLYETIDKLLGGMGTGCLTAVEILGSMSAHSYQTKDVKTVSSAIIEVRNRGDKAKLDAKLLKRLLARFCTWRSTAATLASACELEVTENLADIVIARWNPEVLMDALLHSEDMVEDAARRKNHFQRLWEKMRSPASFQKRLVLFGGIATALCNDFAAQQYADWLLTYPDARLYVAYESGPAALARAKRLGKDFLETESGLPSDAEERMLMKEEKVEALRDLIVGKVREKAGNVAARINIIPLKEPLTSYIMIADDQVFITPLFEKRSSETLTFALAPKPAQFRLDVYNFVIYHLLMLEQEGSALSLIEELRGLVPDGN